jgi:acylphosphatase
MTSAERRIVRMVASGRVQGVGFRAFVTREAERLGVAGWVRNRVDGSVEAVAAGPSGAIEQLAASVRRGPWAARVDAFRLEEADEAVLAEAGDKTDRFVAAPTL